MAKLAIRPEEHLPDTGELVGMAPADAEALAHRLPGTIAVDRALLRLETDRRLDDPGALVEETQLVEELDELVVGEIWYAADEVLQPVLELMDVGEVGARAEVGAVATANDDLPGGHVGDDELVGRSLEVP